MANGKSISSPGRVMSSCLCKKAEGPVPPLVPFVVAIEDGIDNAVHALDVEDADHGACATTHLHKAALDDIGGAQLGPEVPRKVEEGEQLGQIVLQPFHHRRISGLPASAEAASGPLGRAPILGPVDGLRAGS